MALLIPILFLFLGNVAVFADSLPAESVAVIYDSGNPDASVGIVGRELLEMGSWYENFEVAGFDKSAIIVKELATADLIRWSKQGKVDSKTKKLAREFFVVKQMRAIYAAQLKYRDRIGDRFAPHINDLIDQEFLPNGFQKPEKQGYHYYIAETGQTARLAPFYKREPTFLAVAVPLNLKKDRNSFAVDHLGEIRFAPSVNFLPSAPVWDYADTTRGSWTHDVVLQK